MEHLKLYPLCSSSCTLFILILVMAYVLQLSTAFSPTRHYKCTTQLWNSLKSQSRQQPRREYWSILKKLPSPHSTRPILDWNSSTRMLISPVSEYFAESERSGNESSI